MKVKIEGKGNKIMKYFTCSISDVIFLSTVSSVEYDTDRHNGR